MKRQILNFLKRKATFIVFIWIFYNFILNVDSMEFSLKKRVKRKVVFTKSSKFFFRLNGKDNVLNYTNMLSHGWGFRINYDLPSSLTQRKNFFKRDVHEDIENIQNPFVLNLVNCVLKRVCIIFSQPFLFEQCGIFCGLAKIIASSDGLEANFFKTFIQKCVIYQERCPISYDKSSIFGL